MINNSNQQWLINLSNDLHTINSELEARESLQYDCHVSFFLLQCSVHIADLDSTHIELHVALHIALYVGIHHALHADIHVHALWAMWMRSAELSGMVLLHSRALNF